MGKYKVYTLGCKLNYAESSSISRSLEGKNLERAEKGEVADVVVINSCAVTAQSEKKTRELIRRAVRGNNGAEVIVTGCYAKLRSEEILSIEGVSAVQKTKELTAFSLGERTRSFLKVQDGCDYHCTYCTVWRARGESRNAPIEEIVAQGERIAAAGVREIVLTGVNIGDFGRSTGNRLYELLVALERIEGISRYRISSIEPNLLTDEIIEFCADSKKFMPHFHIPLQSGCDSVLRRMGRRYTSERFREKVEAVRALMPSAFIGVDVIVGFPGESDEDFEVTYSFLENLAPSFLHIFPYSVRPNTVAADMDDHVAEPKKKERVARLSELSDRLLVSFREKHLSEKELVLVEGRGSNGLLFGHTEHYLRVEFEGEDTLIGDMTFVSRADIIG
ncbi:MAG: MiaB/RimO family radical SAM methylthiotransferase [Rikenellaceae bacterium]